MNEIIGSPDIRENQYFFTDTGCRIAPQECFVKKHSICPHVILFPSPADFLNILKIKGRNFLNILEIKGRNFLN